MNAKNVLGLIFPNTYDEAVSEMTAVRALGSIPFAGGYRLIDFILSSMVNSGIQKVGIVTKNNYQSLMDHLGNGKPWDLSRKYDGLFILPPYNTDESGAYNGRISGLKNISKFIQMSREEYVLLSDCHAIYNMDIGALLERHIANGADITVVCKRGRTPALDNVSLFTGVDPDGRVREVRLAQEQCDALYSIGVMLLPKLLLLRLVNDASARGENAFESAVIRRNVDNLRIFADEAEGFIPVIDSLSGYFEANMQMLDRANRASLLTSDRPVYTKVRDDTPAFYEAHASSRNSLIADGTVIEGTVENSIIFRAVRVEKGAVVRNSIILPGTTIAENSKLNFVIADKDVVIGRGRELSGAPNFPFYIGKGITV